MSTWNLEQRWIRQNTCLLLKMSHLGIFYREKIAKNWWKLIKMAYYFSTFFENWLLWFQASNYSKFHEIFQDTYEIFKFSRIFWIDESVSRKLKPSFFFKWWGNLGISFALIGINFFTYSSFIAYYKAWQRNCISKACMRKIRLLLDVHSKSVQFFLKKRLSLFCIS